jgi:hypothetical protein
MNEDDELQSKWKAKVMIHYKLHIKDWEKSSYKVMIECHVVQFQTCPFQIWSQAASVIRWQYSAEEHDYIMHL